MCVVCQNVPAVMTGLSGAGLMVRAAIRRTRSTGLDAAIAVPHDQEAAASQAVPATPAPAPVGAR